MSGLRGGIARLLGVLAIPALVAISTYAFAASNTVPTSAAGEGASSISGYTISNIDYTLNSINPANVDQVEFDLNTAPPGTAEVKVKLVASSTTWYGCTISSGTHATCLTSGATVAAADQLSVVVAD